MTDHDTTDTPPGVRVMTDGGVNEPAEKHHGVTHAKAVEPMDIGGEETDVLRVPISSTRADREGDEFSREALEAMADQIRDEKPLVFQNHGLAGSWMDAIPYDQAETIGTHHDAEVVEADDGEAELMSFINPDGTHPEGERMLKQVRDEQQAVKFSVGFKIKGYEEKEDDQGNTVGRVFTDVDLMEDSKVGIPANPDASAPVGAKDGTEGLPGYSMHPMVQMMQNFGGPQADGTAVKQVAPDGGEPDAELRDVVSDLSEAVGELRSEVAELREDDGDDDDDDGDDDGKECSVDTDCPEGEVCLEGECVPEDEVDDDADPEETDDATPDAVLEAAQELDEDQLDALRSALSDGPGDSETGDPTTDDGADLVDETDSTEPDESAESDTRDTEHERIL